MKNLITVLFLSIGVIATLFAGTPTMDGTFDGLGVWDTPVASADVNIGFAGAQARNLYITYDGSYAYFGAEVIASPWMAWAFAINTKPGGGTNDSWSRQITYGYADKPDFVVRGHFNSYAQLNYWDGSSWQGWDGLAASEFGENITTNDQEGWVEIRVPLTTLNVGAVDAQFYITGDNNNHGTFDACPDDQNATDWSPPGSTTVLDNYYQGAPLPIQLVSFFGSLISNNSVKLEWQTISEVNNYGFNVQRYNGSVKTYETISFVAGKGTTLEPQTYSYVDENVSDNVEYRLEQIDNNGLKSYFGPILINPNGVDENSVPAVFQLNQNYPNPFNPSTKISFSISNNDFTTLKVYNMLGTEVATLFAGNAEAGRMYEAKFDGKNLTSGIYFYKLQSGNMVEVRKLTLVK